METALKQGYERLFKVLEKKDKANTQKCINIIDNVLHNYLPVFFNKENSSNTYIVAILYNYLNWIVDNSKKTNYLSNLLIFIINLNNFVIYNRKTTLYIDKDNDFLIEFLDKFEKFLS